MAHVSEKLDFIWLELTNHCNLFCSHCYAESGPSPSNRDVLTYDEYVTLLSEAAELGVGVSNS